MNIILISIVFGLFMGLAGWQIYRMFHEVPDEDRSFLDQPAMGFKLVWPLIAAVEHHWGKYFSHALVEAVYIRLRIAGKDFSIMPKQFIAAKIVSATIFSVFGLVLFAMLGNAVMTMALLAGVGGYYYPELWLKEAAARRKAEIFRKLPFYLDIITLAIEAGTNLTGGLTQAVAKSGDSPLRSEFSRVLRDIRAGKTRSESLKAMSERSGSSTLNGVISSMIQAERTGSSLGPILRAQANQIRNERFLKAEKLAMEAPVKLLGPLLMFIFPCTFMVLGFLLVSKAILEGAITWAPLVWAYNWPG